MRVLNLRDAEFCQLLLNKNPIAMKTTTEKPSVRRQNRRKRRETK